MWMRIFVFLVALTAIPLAAKAADVRLAWIWDAPSDRPQGYIVERKMGRLGTYVKVAHVTETEWTDTNIPTTNTIALYWQVRAVNELGITDPSNEVSLSLQDVPGNIRLVLETFGPSPTARRVSVRTKVRKKR